MIITPSFPLAWPEGWQRTPAHRRMPSRFQVSDSRANLGLRDELRKLDARNVTLSTNVAYRRDGLPYANQKRPDDPGVAVYWDQHQRGGKVERVMACDRWPTIGENVHAIALSIGALRGLDRWGATDLVEKAFAGFAALPAAAVKRPWWEVLGVLPSSPLSVVEAVFKAMAKDLHPDRGGDADAFRELSEAVAEARKAAAHA